MKRQKPPSADPPLSFRQALRKRALSQPPSAKSSAQSKPPPREVGSDLPPPSLREPLLGRALRAAQPTIAAEKSLRGGREDVARSRGLAGENVAKSTRNTPPSSPPEPEKAPSPADYVRGARPLAPRVERIAPPTRSAPPSERPLGRAPDETTPIFEMRSDETKIEGARVGFAQRLRDLARGLLPVFDTLDLHGYTAEKAEKAVRAFCSSARGTVPRTVLIVHGKGRHSDGGRSVLRDEIALWLSSAPVAKDVLCFVTARSKHGGGGAMYVLLAARTGTASRGDAGPTSRR